MELFEVPASEITPYRCYVKGRILQSEGENVHTIGFKDGLAVVKVINPNNKDNNTTAEMRDKQLDKKPIDISKLKKVIVKVDPLTGKKYIFKDGKKIEIVSNIQPPKLFNFNHNQKQPVRSTSPPALTPIKKAPPLNGLVKTAIIDKVKYQVVSVNVKKPGQVICRTVSTMTDFRGVGGQDKGLQTDGLRTRHCCTQTDLWGSSDSFYNFILGDEFDGDSQFRRNEAKKAKSGVVNKLEDLNKFMFFNDMRTALNFDRSGNLPIHESVLRNDVRAVQKNCVVLKAIKENVNIVNQQGFTPLHLAVIHDMNMAIVHILLKYESDLTVTDPEGNTAIHLAVEHGRSAMLKTLVMYAYETSFNLDVFNYDGFTPLILACLNRSYQDAKLLLQHNADPNIKDMKSGRTALFHAAECFDVKLVDLLMEYKADTKIRNFFGTSPHDAMFEVEDMPNQIKYAILGRDHQRLQGKKKPEGKLETARPLKKTKLETTPVLRKVCASDLIMPVKRK